MVLHLKLGQLMACKGGRKKLLLFLLCAVITQYALVFATFSSYSALIRYTERCRIPKGKEKNEWWSSINSVSAIYLNFLFIVAMTRAKRHLVSFFFGPLFYLSILNRTFQCVVGDSSTVCHGSKYLKKWVDWLDANADVKYAGLE